jgi:hypothetical protein
MVLAASGPLLTPSPSSSPPKTGPLPVLLRQNSAPQWCPGPARRAAAGAAGGDGAQEARMGPEISFSRKYHKDAKERDGENSQSNVLAPSLPHTH